MQNPETALDRLEKVVDETAKALRCGDLAAMGALAARTDAALSELGPEVAGERIAALRDAAERNARGLEAAGRGVRAARRRLAEIISARSGVQTYDISGKTQYLGSPKGALKTRL